MKKKKEKIVTFNKSIWAYYKKELGKEYAEKMLIEDSFKRGYVPMKPFSHQPMELSVDTFIVSCICGYSGKKSAREFGVVESPKTQSFSLSPPQ